MLSGQCFCQKKYITWLQGASCQSLRAFLKLSLKLFSLFLWILGQNHQCLIHFLPYRLIAAVISCNPTYFSNISLISSMHFYTASLWDNLRLVLFLVIPHKSNQTMYNWLILKINPITHLITLFTLITNYFDQKERNSSVCCLCPLNMNGFLLLWLNYISGMFGLLVVSSRISVFLETFTNICSSLKASQALLSCQVGYLCSQLLWSGRNKYFIHASEVFTERGVAINNRLDVKKGTQSFSLPFARTSLRLTREENYFIFAWNEKQYMPLLKIMISMSVQVGSFFFFSYPWAWAN